MCDYGKDYLRMNSTDETVLVSTWKEMPTVLVFLCVEHTSEYSQMLRDRLVSFRNASCQMEGKPKGPRRKEDAFMVEEPVSQDIVDMPRQTRVP